MPSPILQAAMTGNVVEIFNAGHVYTVVAESHPCKSIDFTDPVDGLGVHWARLGTADESCKLSSVSSLL